MTDTAEFALKSDQSDLTLVNNFAVPYKNQGKYDKAEPLMSISMSQVDHHLIFHFFKSNIRHAGAPFYRIFLGLYRELQNYLLKLTLTDHFDEADALVKLV